jgi:hypothetical protein
MALEPFEAFIARTARATAGEYSDVLSKAARGAGLTEDESRIEFEKMKAYILDYYATVVPVHSFLDEAGNTIDCVPFDQQPSVRAAHASGCRISAIAPRPATCASTKAAAPEVRGKASDPLCPEGTVPIPRITLEQLVLSGRFEDFFRKNQASKP